MATVLRYPLSTPVSGDYLDGPDAPTGRIDYLKIQRFRIDYGNTKSGYGGTNLPSNEVAVKLDDKVAYLYIPPQLSTRYTANYEQIGMGAAGVFAAQMVGQMGRAAQGGGINGDQILQQLKTAASAALPEFAYAKGASLINSFTMGLTNGAGNANALQALTAGRVMNPYTEQVFNGVSFRNHTFNFKMFARNKKDAQEILNIITYLKVGTLPKYGDADLKAIENMVNTLSETVSSSTGSTEAPSINLGNTTAPGAFLEVPDRYLLEFVRLNPSSDTIEKIPHYKFQPCVCTGFNVNYAPDGQYVSFKDAIADLTDGGETGPKQLFVPAVEISIDLAETRILTQADGLAGF